MGTSLSHNKAIEQHEYTKWDLHFYTMMLYSNMNTQKWQLNFHTMMLNGCMNKMVMMPLSHNDAIICSGTEWQLQFHTMLYSAMSTHSWELKPHTVMLMMLHSCVNTTE